MVLRFAGCELDLERVVLRRQGREVRIEPQAFDLLAYLIAHRGTMVRKERLLDDVWGDRFVSESALTTRIKAVRQAVGDDGTRQAIIRTVHGKGYEFVATVESADDESVASRPPVTVAGLGIALEPLIGRKAQLCELVAELADHRLITLVGPGGVGKTALALELARTVAAEYEDGVHLIELVQVVNEDATAAAFATAIDVNLRRSSSIDDAIVEMLRPRCSLLLLDNCEHLVEPVAGLVARILREAPTVSVLATSREPLAVPGEQVRSVAPLATGTDHDVETLAEIPAVALFATRARAADPGFALDERTAPIVAEVCRRLDGIPLAIELAAARVRSLGVAEIASRLDERFGVLKAMRRGSDPRHRAMSDTISWSYDLLEPDEQALFVAISVFAGSFDLDAANAVCPGGDVLDLLTRLTERSMLTVRPQSDGATRYELLETLRDYGRARAVDEEAIPLFSTHASHFAAEAAAIERELRTSGEAAAMARAESCFADLRSAHRFALESGRFDDALELVSSIREFAMRAVRYEAFAWADEAGRAGGARDHPLLPLVTGIRSYGAWVRGEFDTAIALALESRDLETALGTPASGLPERTLANVLYIVDDHPAGNHETARQLEIAEASGNDSRLVHACYFRAVGLSSQGLHDDAAELVVRAQEHARRTQCPTDLASVEVARGFASPDEAEALDAFVAADRIAGGAGNRWMRAFAATEAAGLRVTRGDVERGCAELAEMVALWYRAGEWAQQWHTLSRCVIALARTGRDVLALQLIGAIEEHATLGVAPMSATLHDVVIETRAALSAAVSEDHFDQLRASGAACPVDEIVLRAQRALLEQP
jgi:predicted ATPase/DNA-binding winged helix-turn-helix (wHTH) protein